MGNIVKVIGFRVASGFRKQDGNPFEMNQLYYVRPLEKTNTPNFKVTLCGGYTASDFNGKVVQLDIDNNAVLLEKLTNLTFPCDVELVFGVQLQPNGTLKQGMVVDINLV